MALIVFRSVYAESLRSELLQRSAAGLVLVVPWNQDGPSLRIRLFDGRVTNKTIACCSLPSEITVGASRITAVELSSTVGTSVVGMGGRVVEMDTNGKVLRKSRLRIGATSVRMAPNGKQFVFVGSTMDSGGLPSSYGLHVAMMEGLAARCLVDFSAAGGRALDKSQPGDTIDWSPDSEHILFSDGRDIFLIDPFTARSEKIAAGHDARWSPRGDQIVLMTAREEVMRMNVATHGTRAILTGREIIAPPLWSPDGGYLLVGERHYSILPCVGYGRLEVYRLFDESIEPIDCFGIQGPRAQWMQLGPQR